MEQFGAYLKSQREKRGIRLEEIASITKIHLHSLQLMEENRWSDLPPEPFIRGFIVAYAKYVGIDPKEAVKNYHACVNPPAVEVAAAETPLGESRPSADEGVDTSTSMATLEKPVATPVAPDDLIKNPPTFPMRYVVGAGVTLVVVGLLAALVSIGKSKNEPKVAVTETPAATETQQASAPKSDSLLEAAKSNSAPEPERKTASTPTPTPVIDTPIVSGGNKEIKAGNSAHQLEVTAKDRTWIKVVVDGSPPVEYFLGQGEKASYSANEKIKLVLGNSTGSQVVHNGQAVDGVKFQGTIRSYIFPENAHFPQDVAARKAITPENPEPDPSDDHPVDVQ